MRDDPECLQPKRATGGWTRRCPRCSHLNPAALSECENNCGEDISGVGAVLVETLQDEAPASPEQRAADGCAVASITLESLALPEVRLTVHDGEIVGREGDVDPSAVPKSQQIQRRHVRVFRENATWYAEHLRGSTGTTFTTVDGHRCKEGVASPLEDGAVISLSYAPFRVRIERE